MINEKKLFKTTPVKAIGRVLLNIFNCNVKYIFNALISLNLKLYRFFNIYKM